jgi:hypothetical protein
MYVQTAEMTQMKGADMHKTATRTDLRAALQELARAGSPVDLSLADSDRENDELEITQLAGLLESSIFELPDGRSAYRIYVRLTNHTSRTLYTLGVELRTSRKHDSFQWLQPLRIPVRNGKKPGTSYRIYQFPGPSGLELPYDEVLNHVLLERRSVTPEHPLEGWLLGVGGRMPAALRHGQMLDVTLTIIGSDHTEYTQTIHLWTERLETRRPKATEKRTNLFEKPLDRHARDAVRVPSVETGMDARSHQLQEPRRRAKPVDDRMLRNQEVNLPVRPADFLGLYGPASRQGGARVHKTIADTVKNPTKPDQGRVDETPSRMKNLAVGRKHLDAG